MICIILDLTNLHGLRLHFLKHDLKQQWDRKTSRVIPADIFPDTTKDDFHKSKPNDNITTKWEKKEEEKSKLDIYVWYLRQNWRSLRTNGIPLNDLFQIKAHYMRSILNKRGSPCFVSSLCFIPSSTSWISTYITVLLNYEILLNVQFTYAWTLKYLKGNCGHLWQSFSSFFSE